MCESGFLSITIERRYHREVANAQGVLDVLQTTSATVEDELTAFYAGSADTAVSLHRDSAVLVDIDAATFGTGRERKAIKTLSKPRFLQAEGL